MSPNLPRSNFSLNSTSSYHNPLLLPSSGPSQPHQHQHQLQLQQPINVIGSRSYSIPTSRPPTFYPSHSLSYHSRTTSADFNPPTINNNNNNNNNNNTRQRPHSVALLHPHLPTSYYDLPFQLGSQQNHQSTASSPNFAPPPLSDIFNLADDEAEEPELRTRDNHSFDSGSPDYHNCFSGEVDERDRSNPLVLHNARLQLARPPTPPLPITQAPSSLKPPLLVRLGHHRRDPTRSAPPPPPSASSSSNQIIPHSHNENSQQIPSQKVGELNLQRRRSAALLAQPPHPRFSNLPRTGPAAATMSLEPAHAVIPPTTASILPKPSSSWTMRPTHDRRSSLPADGIPVHGACYPPRELGGKAGRAGELLERVMSREPVRLRDVVLRITFTFDEHHRCAAGCRRAMVTLGRMRTTLPPGPMNPVRVGDITVQPPLPSIRHEPCGLGRVPRVDVEWSDGTWQAFEPLDMSSDEILKRCHFDPSRAF